MDLKIPSLNVEHELLLHDLDKLENSKSRLKPISDISLEELGINLEDLDGKNRSIMDRIKKHFANLYEDAKSIIQNFETLRNENISSLKQRVENINGSYKEVSGSIDNNSVMGTFAVYNLLGVCSGHSVDNYLKYAEWAKGQIFQNEIPNGINDYVSAFFSNDEKYKIKSASTKYLDEIKNKEIRSWLHSGTYLGGVARVAGPNTYIVSIHKANIGQTLTSDTGLLFGGSILRIDNYSGSGNVKIPSLSKSDYEKLVAFLKAEIADLDGLVAKAKDYSKRADQGSKWKSSFKIIVAGLGVILARKEDFGDRLATYIALISKLRTVQKMYIDWVISYVKYLSALATICEEHSA